MSDGLTINGWISIPVLLTLGAAATYAFYSLSTGDFVETVAASVNDDESILPRRLVVNGVTIALNSRIRCSPFEACTAEYSGSHFGLGLRIHHDGSAAPTLHGADVHYVREVHSSIPTKVDPVCGDWIPRATTCSSAIRSIMWEALCTSLSSSHDMTSCTRKADLLASCWRFFY